VTRSGAARVDALEATADHLAEALAELERADYNVPEERELQRLLDARDTVEAICQTLRKREHTTRRLVEERRETEEPDDGE